MQGLSFFNQAMEHWPRAGSRTQLTRAQMDTPVDRWLFDGLKGVFAGWDVEYPAWSKVLGNSQRHFEGWGVNGSGAERFLWWYDQIPDTPVDSLLAAERQRLFSAVQQSSRDRRATAEALRMFVGGSQERARWAFEMLLQRAHAPVAIRNGRGIMIPLSLSAPWSDALDEAASLCAEPWRSQYRALLSCARALSAIYAVFPEVKGMDNQTAENFVRKLIQQFSAFGFPKTALSLSTLLAADGSSGIQSRNVAAELSPAAPWWSRDFLDWFGAFLMRNEGMSQICKVRGPKCKEFIENVASHCARDDQGRGRLFAPGLMIALTLSAAFDQPIDESWTTAYRDATGSTGVVWPGKRFSGLPRGSTGQH